MRLEIRRRVMSVRLLVMDEMPRLMPWSIPNRKNAVMMESTVRIVRAFLRQIPDQISTRYFTVHSVNSSPDPSSCHRTGSAGHFAVVTWSAGRYFMVQFQTEAIFLDRQLR